MWLRVEGVPQVVEIEPPTLKELLIIRLPDPKGSIWGDSSSLEMQFRTLACCGFSNRELVLMNYSMRGV